MTVRLQAVDDEFWNRLRYQGAPIKQHVLGDLPESAAAFLGNSLWQSFKQFCAAEGNMLPLLVAESEPQDSGMFRRRSQRKPRGSDPFVDLPLSQRVKAEAEFRRLCEKWSGNLPSWRRAILAGVARRLVLHPHDSEWGRRMRRIKGGVHCQRKYREQGWHPLASFNQAMAKRRKGAVALLCDSDSRETEAPKTGGEEARARLGITPEQMRGVPCIAPILESIEGGIEQVVEALRWSRDNDAVAFLAKYNSVPQTDLNHLSIDEICVAAGVLPKRLLSLALDRLIYIFLSKAEIQLWSHLPGIIEASVKNALTDRGWRGSSS